MFVYYHQRLEDVERVRRNISLTNLLERVKRSLMAVAIAMEIISKLSLNVRQNAKNVNEIY